MNKLGIFMNFWEKNWEADHIKYIKKASDIGFDILEFQAQPLLEKSKEWLDEVKAVAKDNNIIMTYSLGLDKAYDLTSDDASVRAGGVEYLKRIVECVSYLEGTFISGVSYEGWGSPSIIIDNKDKRRDYSVNCMKEISKTAADYGVTYCVEAVNRFEGTVINTAEEAVDYVKRVDSKNVGILLDTFHMTIEENDMGDAIRTAGSYLMSLHTGENNRMPPGRGTLIDWDKVFKALKDIEFKGNIVSEPFVQMGGEVGRDIKVWRDLIPGANEDILDKEAKGLLDFTKGMLIKYGME
ncbi:MAG: sugar phosphate isomerase/epimerase family protein [Suipraeoptans sp.]